MEYTYKLNYYFILLILATYILPSISGLPYTPSASFYVPFWLILLLFTQPKIFFSKGFLIAYLFLVLHIIYVMFSFYSIDKDNPRVLLDEVLPLMFSFSVLEYYQRVRRYNEFKVISNLVFYGTIITCITSSISLLFFPDAARGLAGGLMDNPELTKFYALIGIGSFYFYIYIAVLSSLFLFLILSIKDNNSLKTKFILLYILSFITVLLSQYGASFALFFIASIAGFLNYYRKKPLAVIIIILSATLLYFSRSLLSSYMLDFANVINLENLSARIINIAGMIDGKTVILTQQESSFSEAYDNLAAISLKSFSANIWTGGGKIGDHTFWYDVLGNYGLIGLIPWLLVFHYLITSRINFFEKRFKVIYMVCILLFIYIGFHKPIRSFVSIPYFSILLPAIIFKIQDFLKINKLKVNISKNIDYNNK